MAENQENVFSKRQGCRELLNVALLKIKSSLHFVMPTLEKMHSKINLRCG